MLQRLTERRDPLHAADVQQPQRVLYRFAAIAECDECGTDGLWHADALERGVDHHPLQGVLDFTGGA